MLPNKLKFYWRTPKMAYNDITKDKLTMGRQLDIMISRAVSSRNRNALTDLKDLFNGAAARVQAEITKIPAAEEKNAGPRFWP